MLSSFLRCLLQTKPNVKNILSMGAELAGNEDVQFSKKKNGYQKVPEKPEKTRKDQKNPPVWFF